MRTPSHGAPAKFPCPVDQGWHAGEGSGRSFVLTSAVPESRCQARLIHSQHSSAASSFRMRTLPADVSTLRRARPLMRGQRRKGGLTAKPKPTAERMCSVQRWVRPTNPHRSKPASRSPRMRNQQRAQSKALVDTLALDSRYDWLRLKRGQQESG
ncbi:hypothetical protein M9458_033651, partial [Cirrhinus mrigala]